MATKDLLSHGIIWRIGDGSSIKVWGDNWLPNIGSLAFHSGLSLPCDAKVADLIDVSVKGWCDVRPTSPGNEDVLICINAPFMTQRVLKP
jgi:hypothetical protein